MKIGDLVICKSSPDGFGLGIIMDFDEEDDPIVFFLKYDDEPQAFYGYTLEVLSEGR